MGREIEDKFTKSARVFYWQTRDHVCGICGGVIDNFHDMHLDHIIPLSKGGTTEPLNIQLAHAICNERKGASDNGSVLAVQSLRDIAVDIYCEIKRYIDERGDCLVSPAWHPAAMKFSSLDCRAAADAFEILVGLYYGRSCERMRYDVDGGSYLRPAVLQRAEHAIPHYTSYFDLLCIILTRVGVLKRETFELIDVVFKLFSDVETNAPQGVDVTDLIFNEERPFLDEIKGARTCQ